MFHAWDFDNRLLCQARLYVNATAIMASALLLLAISVTRWVIPAAHYSTAKMPLGFDAGIILNFPII